MGDHGYENGMASGATREAWTRIHGAIGRIPIIDSLSFDQLTRRFVRTSTRRRILSALFATVALGSFRQLALAEVSPDVGIPLGGTCADTSECSQFQGCSASAPILCAENGFAEDGPLNCCLSAGGLCGDDRHCCGGLLCLDSGGDGCGAGTCQIGNGTSTSGDCTTQEPASTAPMPGSVPSGLHRSWTAEEPANMFAWPGSCHGLVWPSL